MNSPLEQLSLKRFNLILFAILLLAFVLRVLAARNDLWLDELVTLRFIETFRQPADIFTRFAVDNNHPLNTLYLYLVGPQLHSPIMLRLASIIFGVATVAVAWWSGMDRPYRFRFLFTLLVAVNYPLIHFSSEARGYAGAAFAALLAYAALDRFITRPAGRWALLFLIATGIGLLSHLTFCLVWAPLILWSFLRTRRLPFPQRATGWVPLILFHLPPLLLFAFLYLGFYSHVRISGGPANKPVDELRRFFALSLGLPSSSPLLLWTLIVLLALGILTLIIRRQRDRHLDLTLHILLFLPPILWLLFFPPALVFARYLLVLSPFLCMALAVLADRFAISTPRTFLAILLLILSISGQFLLLARFLPIARGNISAAAALLGEQNSTILRISSDDIHRQSIEFPYLASFLPPDKVLRERPEPGEPSIPEWYILRREGREIPPPDRFRTPDGSFFQKVASYPCSELSGQAWYLYHLQPPAATSP